MPTIGLIGAGHIGSQLARLAVANGYDVVLSNSRGPETLSSLVAELGPRPARRPSTRPPRRATSSSSPSRSRTTGRCRSSRSKERS